VSKEAILSLDIGTVNLKTLAITTYGKQLWLSKRNISKTQTPRKLWTKILNEIMEIPSSIRSNIKVITITSHGPSFVVKTYDNRENIEPYYKQISNVNVKSQLNFHEIKLLSIVNNYNVKKVKWILGLKEYIAYRFTNIATYDKLELREKELRKHVKELESKIFAKGHDCMKPIGYIRKSLSKKLGLKEKVSVIVAPTDAICSLIGVGCLDIGCTNLNLGYTVTLLNIANGNSKNECDVIGYLLRKNVSLRIDSVIIGHAISFAKKVFSANSSTQINNDLSLIIPMIRKGMSYKTTISAINISHDFTYAKALRTIITTALLYLSLNSTDKKLGKIRLSGGLVSDEIAKLVSNIFDTEVQIPKNIESSVLGASFIGISYLNNEDLATTVKRNVEIEKIFTPSREETVKYSKYLEVFRKIYDILVEAFLN